MKKQLTKILIFSILKEHQLRSSIKIIYLTTPHIMEFEAKKNYDPDDMNVKMKTLDDQGLALEKSRFISNTCKSNASIYNNSSMIKNKDSLLMITTTTNKFNGRIIWIIDNSIKKILMKGNENEIKVKVFFNIPAII